MRFVLGGGHKPLALFSLHRLVLAALVLPIAVTGQQQTSFCSNLSGFARMICEKAVEKHGKPKIPSDQLLKLAIDQIKAAVIETVGSALGDNLPIHLDASSVFPPVGPPAGFKPTAISCSFDNVSPLAPGDYTCEVRLYCMRASIHRPSQGIPYGLAVLQGKQATAIATLLNRGADTDIEPSTLQTISWSIQASVPLGQMPPLHQRVVQQVIPDLASSLQGDFLQDIDSAYNKYKLVPNMPTLDSLLSQMGEAGRIVQNIRREREIIRRNALDYESLNQRLFDGPSEQQTLTVTGAEPSRWSEIQPGVIAQLVIEGGNLRPNRLNFRILPRAVAGASAHPNVRFASTFFAPQVSAAPTFNQVITVIDIITGLTPAGRGIRIGRALIAYALHGIQAQALVMAMSGSNGSGGNNQANKESTPTTDPDKFENVRGTSAKRNKETDEIWELDRLHKDHYEVYRDKKFFDRGQRDRSVWTDGRPKELFR